MQVSDSEEARQREWVDRFEAAYNSIDRFLRSKYHKDNSFPFSSLLELNWPDRRAGIKVELRAFGDLRNALVHSKIRPGKPLAYPSLWTVERIERIQADLMSGAVVIPLFQRDVLVLQTSDSLTKVMALIRENNFSQFPVYEGRTFQGLLTENGITRWLANHLSAKADIRQSSEIRISQLLVAEEGGDNYAFCHRNTPIDELLVLFARKPLVEAILITENGKKHEKLIGIVTRWDILKYG